ncbi:MAG TPA: DUF5522 domain-containing protein [Ktedonobacteraceae bacterium]
MEQDGDWEITPEGLYRATREFLIRRSHCCGNRCSNCPYVNWRMERKWQPLPAENVRRTRGSRRSIGGARALLDYHQEQVIHAPHAERSYHQKMIGHYQQLLERWQD